MKTIFFMPYSVFPLLQFLPRRVAVVDQIAAPLQVRIPLKHVPVERGLLEQLARGQQVGALVHEVQPVERVAQLDRTHLAHRSGRDVERRTDAVTHVAGAEKRQHEVRPGPGAPAAEGLAEVLVVLLEAPFGSHVVDAEQAERAIKRKARPVVDAVLELALQEAVHADEDVLDVGKKVSDAGADLLVQHLDIGARHRLREILVEGVVELVDAAVETLPRVARVALLAGGRAPRKHRGQKKGEAAHHRCQTRGHFAGSFAGSLPSAALLNRNWLIRFSSTTADCVRRSRSPFLSITPSPPASSPTYCSPRMPEVRILAVVSRGNW